MGKNTMSRQILTKSYGLLGVPVYMSPSQCARLQELFFQRYWGVKAWHKHFENLLKTDGSLTAFNGFKRTFYGRRTDSGTLQQMLAHMPQVITTDGVKRALWRLWSDPENKREDGSLRVEPLLCVHDSLLAQGPVEGRAWAKAKLAEWFDNPMRVESVEFVIPASSTAGPNWQAQEEL